MSLASDSYTFVNQLWDYSAQTDPTQIYFNIFSSVNIETVFYVNTDYDTYVNWLAASGGAATYVDESDDSLTSSLLASFNSKVASYSSWSMHVQFEFNNVSVTNQEVAFCIQELIINNGITCAGASTGSSTIKMQDTFTYWLPESMSTDLTGSYDLTQSGNDDYRNDDDYFGGLTHWDVTLATDNIIEANKFLPNQMNSNDQWTFEVGDFAYVVGDLISIYTMNEDGSHTITWENVEYRKLGATAVAASAMVALSAILEF